ncbi:LiaF transmembrane domain-containing protein [Halapricum desulfuricans]|uniref:Putative membrane protein n=1 Tax=Halapricum desulfuricans TaxID=2841257 RepID=A0A897NTI3_9EURY|nr:LiaF domain-containing protein [Halapricum desulfuricans]QSG16118.1 putative membrane protein [Halapricum desulfuricans]
MQTRRISSQSVLGALVIVIGLALLAETTGYADVSVFWTYVPSLFVLLGLFTLVASGFRNVVGPVIVVAVASAWQLVALEYLTAEEVIQLWPLAIVLFGLSIVLGQYRSRVKTVDGSYVSGLGVFGGSEKRASKLFTGGTLTALFGGASLDLRDTTLEDRPVTIAATAAFGGVDIIVPREWNVTLDVLPIFGGASDDRLRTEHEHDDVDLIVTGFAVFGGVTVKD